MNRMMPEHIGKALGCIAVLLLISSPGICRAQEEVVEEPDFAPIEEIVVGRASILLPAVHISFEDGIPPQSEIKVGGWRTEMRDPSVQPKLLPLPSGAPARELAGLQILVGNYGVFGGEMRFGMRAEDISLVAYALPERARWADPKSHRVTGCFSIDLGYTPGPGKTILIGGMEAKGGTFELPGEGGEYDSQEKSGFLAYLRWISDPMEGVRIWMDLHGSLGRVSYNKAVDNPDKLDIMQFKGSANLLWTPIPGRKVELSIRGRRGDLEFLGDSRHIGEIEGIIGYQLGLFSFIDLSSEIGLKWLDGGFNIEPKLAILYKFDPLTSIDIGLEGSYSLPDPYEFYLLSDYLYPNLLLKPQRGIEVWSEARRRFGDILGIIKIWGKDVRNMVVLKDGEALVSPDNQDFLIYGATLSLEMPLGRSMRLKAGWDRRESAKLPPYYPKDLLFVKGEWKGPRRMGLEVGWDFVGDRYADLGNEEGIPGYNSLDISFSSMLVKDISISLKARNLMNSKAILYKGYEMPGRQIVLGLDMAF